MTVETIEVQIDKHAVEARSNFVGGQDIAKFVQARKADAKLREAHQQCAQWIETDNDIDFITYLRKNPALLVTDIVDSNGKTLVHECTFNDSVKCLKALLAYSQEQVQTPQQLATWIN